MLAEKALIAKIRKLANPGSRLRARNGAGAVVAGIGDDCAVLRLLAGRDALVTTDFTLEGIHFRHDWHPARSVGHRCLARGLSDIAAMGGEPVAAFLSLALPRGLPQGWIREFLRGLIGLAAKYGVVLAGGDTAESPAGLLADIVVLGAVPKGKAVLRSGARVGDRIFVSGGLGGSAAALAKLRAGAKAGAREYARHFYPQPRIELGRMLRERGIASAMIDTSDGLSTDLAHICRESGVGAEISEALIPRASAGRPAREVELDLALHGGEDYELLFTVSAKKRVPSQLGGVRLTEIGRIVRGRTMFVRNREGRLRKLEDRGWEHFRE